MENSGTFLELQTLIQSIEKTSSYTEKTATVQKFLKTFSGDYYLLLRLLLCREDKRAYNLREKGFVAVLSQILECSQKDMITDLEKGDLGETIKTFFITSKKSAKKSSLTLKEVDDWLETLATYTTKEDQIAHFKSIIDRCTPNDLYYLTKIIDHDLKINIGPKFALEAIHPDAFKQWKITNNLKSVIQKAQAVIKEGKPGLVKSLSLNLDLMTPVKPMLAKASKSIADTISRCPNGMLAETKYDGERIQIHKDGENYQTFTRNLKAVTPHKVADVKEYIPIAFKDAKSIILDAEILLQDAITKKPLPFGTLGIHKKSQFSDATLCLYIFDILHLNGKNLMSTPMIERRRLLEKSITEVPGHIVLTSVSYPKTEEDLQKLFDNAVKDSLEGLVIKDFKGIYEPNMRYWIKMKKEHFQGMGDSADLVVLGAYYGTGNKGGKMSRFLMGTYDEDSQKFRTVVKVGNGFSDKEIDDLQKSLKVKKIEKDPSQQPDWLICLKPLLPDFVVVDPKKAPVWEIGGAEFSPSPNHTASRISIRFPRVLRVRDDKDWETATNLKGIEELFALGGINRVSGDPRPNQEAGSKKRSRSDDEESQPPNKKAKTIASLFKPVSVETGLFKGCCVLFYGKLDRWFSDAVLSGGGIVVHEDDPSQPVTLITHIVTDNTWEEILFESVLRQNSNCKFVSSQWVKDSVKNGSLEAIQKYKPSS